MVGGLRWLEPLLSPSPSFVSSMLLKTRNDTGSPQGPSLNGDGPVGVPRAHG